MLVSVWCKIGVQFIFLHVVVLFFSTPLICNFIFGCTGSCCERGLLSRCCVAAPVAASLVWSTGPGVPWAAVVVAHGLACSVACGIFPGQGSNPCLLHWQADSSPLSHQGSPSTPLIGEIVLFPVCIPANFVIK